jgi:hypothetical protein
MSNEHLTDGVTYPMRRIAEKLRAAADRIDAAADDLHANPGPRHGSVAAATVAEVMSMLGNLNVYNLVDNAAYAARDWAEKPETMTVTLVGVDMSGRVNAGQIQTIKVLRELQLPEQEDGFYLNDLMLQRNLLWTVMDYSTETFRYQPVSTVLTSRATPERAREITNALATVGATVRVTPTK